MPQQEEIKLIERSVVAGALAMEQLLATGVKVESTRKADRTFVMNLDLASQGAMLPVLRSGGIPVVSEEDPASHSEVAKKGTYFVVDPLDGTASCRRCVLHHGKFVDGNVGFGPMAGLAKNGIITAAAYFNLPDRKLYSASRGAGTTVVQISADNSIPDSSRQKLKVTPRCKLSDAAALFYPGKRGEMEFSLFLRKKEYVDSLYRFGGFASDCTRMARGFEELEIQFSLRAWDVSGALLAEEAGFDVIMDPLGKSLPLAEWHLSDLNPAIVLAPGLKGDMLKACREYREQA